MAANLTTPLLGVVSMTVIGRLGDATLLGGVALATTAFNFTFWMFGFLRMGTVGFTAQSIGAGDTTETRAVFGRGALIALVLGALLISLQWPLAALLFHLLGGSEAVTSAAKLYFKIRVWSAPFLLTNYVVIGWLVGNARAGRALTIQIVINLVKLVALSCIMVAMSWKLGLIAKLPEALTAVQVPVAKSR